jgi:biopolymer transport protein ExbD
MLVEANRDIPWTKPEDIEIDADPAKPLPKVGGHLQPDGMWIAAFCDGSVRVISDAIDPKTLRALFTVGGREPVDSLDTDPRQIPARPPFDPPSGAATSGGSVQIDSGTTKLAVPNVGEVTLYGPAQFELVDGARARLNKGRIRVRVTEPSGQSFTVETPHGEVTDLGKDYELNVSPEKIDLTQHDNTGTLKAPGGNKSATANNAEITVFVDRTENGEIATMTESDFGKKLEAGEFTKALVRIMADKDVSFEDLDRITKMIQKGGVSSVTVGSTTTHSVP